MAERADPRLEKLRRKLRERGDKLPPQLQKMTRAALEEPEDNLSHAECIAALPAYVMAELENMPLAIKYPEIKRHLDTCESCAAQYAELLEITVADQAGQLSMPAQIPEPQLQFLLYDFVKQKAAEIMAAIMPAALRDLQTIADVFFEQVESLGGKFSLQPSTAQALGFGSGDVGDALAVLAATYAAMNAVIESLTAEEIDSLVAQNLLCARIEKQARTAALDIQLKPAMAQKFAEQFARRTCDDPSTLRALIRH